MGEIIIRFLNAQLDVGLGRPILWREIVGNLFGLASALGGARRRVWAWPVGILGNVLLFTVFLGGVFHTPQDLDLWGQAGRQVFFIITSVYGWVVWANYRRSHAESQAAVKPRWATGRERLVAGAVAIVMLVVFYLALKALGSWGPGADSWILTGSILATYGMARGWNEFWFVWIAVDLVGVPLLLSAHYYPSALMYSFYAAFCIFGFVTWWRSEHRPADEAVATADS
ncbi:MULTISPECIES: nicotinamide riboside transporter PnuC [Acidipropionibacterium]|uniref:nicotinamide riboside transporter PnuC n=1 Tax=Acidipropionibacterium TaxID=1912215 RepID=UPI00041E5F5F|nr:MULTISPECIES: nicotinamide riboside transporter PnuC [Acidipropionibacterium]